MTTKTETPKIDRVDVGGVPEELLDNRWVNWRYEWRQNHRGEWKLTKVLRTPEGMAASHSDPQTWRSWEQVFDYALESGGALGIGRVLSADDPYFMLDLDNAYEDDKVKKWAEPWVKFAKAYHLYIEVSPSGTGLKIIGRGALPGSGRRKKILDANGEKIGEIECYDRLRFTTITGDNFGSLDTVGDGQDLVDRLHAEVFGPERQANDPGDWPGSLWSDEEVVRRACESERFRKAWGGDFTDYANDASSAEFAIANRISRFSRDPHQTERIMRGNKAIAREKWDEHKTYLFERTILNSKPDDDEFEDNARLISHPDRVSRVPVPNALGHQGHPSHGVEYSPIDIHAVEFCDRPRPQGSQPYLVADIMPENYPTVFFGDGGTLKSLLMGHIGQCVARGIPWMGHATKQTNVLMLDFELDHDTQSRRAYDTAAGMGHDSPPRGMYYVEGAGRRPADMFRYALNFCQQHGVGLVIIDSLGVALEGDAEASRDVIGFMREHVDKFRAAGITTLIVDHQGKLQTGERYQNKTQFGSAYKKHLSRSVFQVEKREGADGERKVTLRHTKTNFGRELEPFGVKVTWGHERIDIEPDELSQADLAEESTLTVSKRILLALEDGPAYPKELAETLSVEPKTVKNRLSDLRKSGKVEDMGQEHNQSRQVRLSQPPTMGVPRVPNPIRDGDGDTWIPDVLLEWLRGKEVCPGDQRQYEAWAETFNNTHPQQVSTRVLEAAAEAIRRERA